MAYHQLALDSLMDGWRTVTRAPSADYWAAFFGELVLDGRVSRGAAVGICRRGRYLAAVGKKLD